MYKLNGKMNRHTHTKFDYPKISIYLLAKKNKKKGRLDNFRFAHTHFSFLFGHYAALRHVGNVINGLKD